MIGVIDYGLGNVQAFLNLYKRLNVPAKRATAVSDLEGVTKVVLPGVGAFDHAMERLDASGLREALDQLVLREQVPVLGVCVGMQILAGASDEGVREGLGWIEGRVRRLPATDADALPLPHMGWNDVQPKGSNPLFDQLEENARFYFLHSYYFDCDRPADVAAVTAYGAPFASAVRAGHIQGVQFHPEKSHHFGTRLLRNFAEF